MTESSIKYAAYKAGCGREYLAAASGLAVPTVLGLSRGTPTYAQESPELAPPSRRLHRDNVIPLYGQIEG